MQILARRLRDMGVPQVTRAIRVTDISDRLSAVVMNSWTPAVPLSKVGGRSLNNDLAFSRLLSEAYATEGLDASYPMSITGDTLVAWVT